MIALKQLGYSAPSLGNRTISGLGGYIFSDISSYRDRYCVVSFICGIEKENKLVNITIAKEISLAR